MADVLTGIAVILLGLSVFIMSHRLDARIDDLKSEIKYLRQKGEELDE